MSVSQPGMTLSDVRFMRLALAQASRGRGDVEPNPMVGAVLVKNGRLIARGYHRYFGGPHAEIDVLKQAARNARGATLYVTLEPCCHTGKTGPCTQAIIAAGVRRVVAAMRDPDPRVRGKGFAALRRAGISVTRDVCKREAMELNRPFIRRITAERPYIIAKWAQTMDGCIADRAGASKWISNSASRRRVHELRGRVDAIVVGIGSVLADDPRLTARLGAGGKIHRTAVRVVIDSRCRLPLQSALVRTCRRIPVLLVHQDRLNPAARRRRTALIAAGVEPLPAQKNKAGFLELGPVFKRMAVRGYTNILVEGGPRLLAQLLKNNLVDEAWVFIAPLILGDKSARHAVELDMPVPLASAKKCTNLQVTRLKDDLLLRVWL